MAELPFIPIYVDAYWADTWELTPEEHGYYLNLLFLCWRQPEGKIPHNHDFISNFFHRQLGITRRTYNAKVIPLLHKFGEVNDGFWTQKRLYAEHEKRLKRTRRTAETPAKNPFKPPPKPLDNNDLAISERAEKAKKSRCIPETRYQIPERNPPLVPPGGDGDPSMLLPELLPDDPKTTLSDAVELWNATATDLGLPVVQKLSEGRKRKLTRRLQDCGGLEGWRMAMEKVRSIPGLHRGKGWKASFDFLMQEQSFIRLMEGSYDNWTERKDKSSEWAAAAKGILDENDDD